MTFGAGEIVFVKHPKHSWIVGNVVSCDKATAVVKCNDPQREFVGEVLDKVKIDDVTSCREDLLDEAPDDLLQLTVLHDATLLRCLHVRYFKDIVYTNIGAIVVALNPFNFKIPWYMDDQMPKYLAEGSVIEKNLPHSWAQAHNTFNEMMADRENQCILISGESGAGKTEATKIVMKYLAQISCRRGTDEEKAAGLLVGTKLNSCSPILEAFGNAKTVRNDNSSRFGKFMKVKFLDTGRLIGAHTTKYLLEKSRIVTASKDERVYHAFYIAPRGHMASKIGLENISAYKSVNSGGCLDNSEFSTAEHFTEVCSAMTTIGMTDTEIESVWMCTGGILSLLNLTFAQKGEGSEINSATRKYLDHAVKVWQIDGAELEKQLTSNTLVIPGGEKAIRVLRPDLATDARDALAKACYNGMFGWLVEKSNAMCDVETKSGNWIGLLDIFGFEDFLHNSFEQLCINLANEQLQNHYNTYIFEKDMAECRAEGIDVTEVKCPDNSPCLRLITDKGGILSLLDEECLLGKSTDLTFLEKVDMAHGNNKNAFFDKKKNSQKTFIIHHYAASVTYDVTGWLEKNRDTLTDDVRRMMRVSRDALIKEFIEPPAADSRSRRTVGGFFKDQVQELMKVINETNPHWIRCVKPHPAKKARMFDGVSTMNQLESSGVLGTVKIRKAGYPIRMTFAKFNVRYRIIVGKNAEKKADREVSQLILSTVQMTDKKFAQVGKSKIFMKSEAFPLIERKRNEFLLNHATRLQRSCRGFMSRLSSNKARAHKVQERFSTLLITEYRDYAKRSQAEREERARLRREAEIKFRGLREQCERDSVAGREALFTEWNSGWGAMTSELERLLQAERARLERTKGEREAFVRQEYNARMRVFDEFLGYGQYLRDLYYQEVAMFYSLEVQHSAETERQARNMVAEEEVVERSRLRRNYMRLHVRAMMVALDTKDEQWRAMMTKIEALQRSEMAARFSIMRHHRSMMHHLAEEKKANKHEARVKMHHRQQFEKWKDRELFKLETLRRDEMFRLYSSRSDLNSTGASTSVDGSASPAHWDVIEQQLAAAEARTSIKKSAAEPQPPSAMLGAVAGLQGGARTPVGVRGTAILRRDVPTYESFDAATASAAATGGFASPSLNNTLGYSSTSSTTGIGAPPPPTSTHTMNPLTRMPSTDRNLRDDNHAPKPWLSNQPSPALATSAPRARSFDTHQPSPYDDEGEEPPFAYPSPERVVARQQYHADYDRWKSQQYSLRAQEGINRYADAAAASLERWEEAHRSEGSPRNPLTSSQQLPGYSPSGFGQPPAADWRRLQQGSALVYTDDSVTPTRYNAALPLHTPTAGASRSPSAGSSSVRSRRWGS